MAHAHDLNNTPFHTASLSQPRLQAWKRTHLLQHSLPQRQRRRGDNAEALEPELPKGELVHGSLQRGQVEGGLGDKQRALLGVHLRVQVRASFATWIRATAADSDVDAVQSPNTLQASYGFFI